MVLLDDSYMGAPISIPEIQAKTVTITEDILEHKLPIMILRSMKPHKKENTWKTFLWRMAAIGTLEKIMDRWVQKSKSVSRCPTMP